MKLKTLLTISALCVPSFLVVFPQKGLALPFNENCASMQAYANAMNWSNPTRFSGFENTQMVKYGMIMCTGGYVKETSPMGTRVCNSQLSYDTSGVFNAITAGGGPGLRWNPISCRWQ